MPDEEQAALTPGASGRQIFSGPSAKREAGPLSGLVICNARRMSGFGAVENKSFIYQT